MIRPACAIFAFSAIMAAQSAPPSPTFERLVKARQEPNNWLTYSGSLRGEHYTELAQINPANIAELDLAWLWQARTTEKFEATPLVVDGVMYTVQPPNNIVALDAFSGQLLWSYAHDPGAATVCCGRVNRGVAVLDGMVFVGTLDARVLAINAQSGKLVWSVTVADSKDPSCGGGLCYAITHAPLIVKDRVLVGVAGGDSAAGGIRGFIVALDARTGGEVWRFHTIPEPGRAGSETWTGDDWKVGGAAVWVTGSYDADLNLTYWGTGNPDVVPSSGDKLFSNSIVALDGDTGRLRWHYQFTPADQMDWDAAHIPVLVDREWKGRQRKLVLMANKNGYFYVLDRVSGEFLAATPFVTANWVEDFDTSGRPRRVQGRASRAADGGISIFPNGGGTNWQSPSYSLQTGLFYVSAWERGPQNLRFGGDSYGAVRALDPTDGMRRWEFKSADVVFAGILTTASGLLFSGSDAGCRSRTDWDRAGNCGLLRGARRGGPNTPRDPALIPQGDFHAFDARTGRLLWRRSVGGLVHSAPISYSVAGKQFIAIAAGDAVLAFALRQ